MRGLTRRQTDRMFELLHLAYTVRYAGHGIYKAAKSDSSGMVVVFFYSKDGSIKTITRTTEEK